ncbi:MAG: molybdate ABC transporter substrate-binding protein [Ramlibacter sp.]|jgi:molybdate transport system substrate-binding protein
MPPSELTVAVAANFAAPMRKIAMAFERESGHRVVMALGSTGSFYAQVRNGAPFHLLLAADEATPRRLEAEGLAVAGTRVTYAIGRLALWSAEPGRVDPQGQVLREGRFERLALANHRLAPYGAAAVQVMERLALPPLPAARKVQGENVGQVFQFVASGNATLGFVALAQVQSEGRIGKGSAWVVPQHLHDPIRQDAVLLLPGRDHAGARTLLAYLGSEPARAVMRAHGYAH